MASKPCLGYPTECEAIEALHSQGLAPRDIAARTRAPLKSVHRTLANIRGGAYEPKGSPFDMWTWPEADRRREILNRAARGARAALEAMGK